MVARMSLPLSDGNMGGARQCSLASPTEWRRTLSLLQLVSVLPPLATSLRLPSHSIISFIGTVAIAVSLAELASIFPTAGGQYHWVAALAPPTYRKTASWVTGWISIGGQICLGASSAFAGGLQLRGLIALNNPNYVPKQWHGLLFYWAVLLYALIANILGTSALSKMNLAAGEFLVPSQSDVVLIGPGVLHVTGFIALTVTIGVLSEKHSASYVFTEVVNLTGWQSDGLAWLIGMLSTVYPFLG